tara:strand:+ start:61 stop:270 length:210 start_codon:yes stop_codon:yes gene_type:complete
MKLTRIEQPEEDYNWRETTIELPDEGRLLDTLNEAGHSQRLIYKRKRWYLPDMGNWINIVPKYWKYIKL